MKGDPEERAAAVGRYIVESGATVREMCIRDRCTDLYPDS